MSVRERADILRWYRKRKWSTWHILATKRREQQKKWVGKGDG